MAHISQNRVVAFIFALITLSCQGQPLSSSTDITSDDLKSHDHGLHLTSETAHRQLQQGVAANADRLAIVILLTDFNRKDKDRLNMLHACLELCAANLFPSTPSSVYIFTQESQVEQLREGLGEYLLPNVAVLPTDRSTWVVPEMAGDPEHWHSGMPIDYRLMGDWRLSYMPEFARRMGHRYLLQLDDDSFILSPVAENLVQLFDRNQYVLAARNLRRDSATVTWGLPELARYFLVTHKVVPTTLFQFCHPPNIEGLYSAFSKSMLPGAAHVADMEALGELQLRERGGWNRTMLYGNCLMFSLDWWFRPEVNRFVQLCRASGGSFAYRWNEQGVIAMLWQIFVRSEQFHHFRFKYAHRVAPDGVLAPGPQAPLNPNDASLSPGPQASLDSNDDVP